ncbi:MAG: hypothetical protein QME49_07775 [bacterium]|nr:hypothetical protein [bacterium]
MIVKFSRHAKRRIKLYNIPELTILDILESTKIPQGEYEIIKDIAGFKFPLKIVICIKENVVTVITAYPLKKRKEERRENEGIL